MELINDTVSVALFVAKQVIAWRQKRRQQEEPIGIHIINLPGKARLNLEIVSDEEITISITEDRKRK